MFLLCNQFAGAQVCLFCTKHGMIAFKYCIFFCEYLVMLVSPGHRRIRGGLVSIRIICQKKNYEACKIQLHDMQRHACKFLVVFGSKEATKLQGGFEGFKFGEIIAFRQLQTVGRFSNNRSSLLLLLLSFFSDHTLRIILALSGLIIHFFLF